MHTKNLSLLIDGKITLMAPMYDVACTGMYQNTKALESHLAINGKRKNITPGDFAPLCKYLDIRHHDFKKEAKAIASIYAAKLPEYIAGVRTLGPLPHVRMKRKEQAGMYRYYPGEISEFADVLEQFFRRRVKSLQRLGWIDQPPR